MCLVPLADVFNHKAAVVAFSSDYTVAEIDDEHNLPAASRRSEFTEAPEAAAGTAAEERAAAARKRRRTSEATSQAVPAAQSVKQARTENVSCMGSAEVEEDVHVMTEQRREGGVLWACHMSMGWLRGLQRR